MITIYVLQWRDNKSLLSEVHVYTNEEEANAETKQAYEDHDYVKLERFSIEGISNERIHD